MCLLENMGLTLQAAGCVRSRWGERHGCSGAVKDTWVCEYIFFGVEDIVAPDVEDGSTLLGKAILGALTAGHWSCIDLGRNSLG